MLHLRPATVPTLRRHRADRFSGRQLGREDDRVVRAARGDQRGRFRQGRVVRNGGDYENGYENGRRGSLGRSSRARQKRRGGADGGRQVGEVAGPLAHEGHPHGRRELRRGDDRRRRRCGSDRGRVERGGGGGGRQRRHRQCFRRHFRCRRRFRRRQRHHRGRDRGLRRRCQSRAQGAFRRDGEGGAVEPDEARAGGPAGGEGCRC